jgi:hypothetical protein
MTKLHLRIRPKAFWGGAIVLGVVLAGFIAHRQYYPHGLRDGMLPTFMGEMVSYADNHKGWYPKDGKSPLESLQKLYPEYESTGLAGLSGSEHQVLKRLRKGGGLDETVSSWVYLPGFRIDDEPELAIIWEREEGLSPIGRRLSGHAVGFACGGCNQISAEDWPEFLKKQEALREQVLAKRKLQGGQ